MCEREREDKAARHGLAALHNNGVSYSFGGKTGFHTLEQENSVIISPQLTVGERNSIVGVEGGGGGWGVGGGGD